MNSKINILFTIPNFKTAGSQFVLLGIYKALDRAQFQPYVLVEKYPEIFPSEIIESERLHLTETVGKASYIHELADLLKVKKIHVLHSWDYKSNSIEALACRKAGVAYLYTKKNNSWSKRWFAKSLLASHVAYNNPEMRMRFFDSIWLRNKITFIPHGLNQAVFYPREKQTEINKVTIGCIGVLGPNKNQLFLLKALAQLPANFQVFFFGKEESSYRKKMNEYIIEKNLENRVFFNGYIANEKIPEAMATFNISVLSSVQEGLPLSIMEAMACGVPILSSNSGGGARYLLEEVSDDCIFELDTPDQLISQLLKLSEQPELSERLKVYGQERIAAHFSIKRETSAYQTIYQKLKK